MPFHLSPSERKETAGVSINHCTGKWSKYYVTLNTDIEMAINVLTEMSHSGPHYSKQFTNATSTTENINLKNKEICYTVRRELKKNIMSGKDN